MFGPFVERSGRLVRFIAYRSSAFIPVNAVFLAANAPGELLLLIPAASTPNAAKLGQWKIAPGTVWIPCTLSGCWSDWNGRFAGRRWNTVIHTAAHPARNPDPCTRWWKLDAVRRAGDAARRRRTVGRRALVLTLPTRLKVGSDAVSVVTGGIAMSGFGSPLNLTVSGKPIADGNQISFPMRAAEPEWTIAGNLSSIAQFTGASAVSSSTVVTADFNDGHRLDWRSCSRWIDGGPTAHRHRVGARKAARRSVALVRRDAHRERRAHRARCSSGLPYRPLRPSRFLEPVSIVLAISRAVRNAIALPQRTRRVRHRCDNGRRSPK